MVEEEGGAADMEGRGNESMTRMGILTGRETCTVSTTGRVRGVTDKVEVKVTIKCGRKGLINGRGGLYLGIHKRKKK